MARAVFNRRGSWRHVGAPVKLVSIVYLILGLIGCAMPYLNAQGLAGQPDPMSGIFPLAVALPWSLLLDHMPWDDQSGKLATGFCVAAVLINFGILRWVGAYASR